MKHHHNGYIVDGPDVIDIDLWRRRLREDRRYCERQIKRLTRLLEVINRKGQTLERELQKSEELHGALP